MSHSHKDAVGGHCTHFLYDDGFYSGSPQVRRWSKKRHSREARREAARITRQSLMEMEEEIEPSIDAKFYDMIYEEYLHAETDAEENRRRDLQYQEDMEHLYRMELEQSLHEDYIDWYD